MAMLALATAACDTVAVATFDHGLRAESAAEAAMVASVCAELGVPHVTLNTDEPIATGSVQAHAREARYTALAAWATSIDIYPLLTAHHADDQAETLLMRLNRASGLKGLSAIRPYLFDHEIVIVRPLLDWTRAELRAVIEHCGLPFVEDPSNDDPRFDRTRVRALLANNPELDATALAASARYLAEAEDVLNQNTELLWTERWRGPGRDLQLEDLPRELQRRLVRRAIIATREHHAIVLPTFSDSANVEPLLDAIAAGRGAVQGGVAVSWASYGWRFSPAPARRSR